MSTKPALLIPALLLAACAGGSDHPEIPSPAAFDDTYAAPANRTDPSLARTMTSDDFAELGRSRAGTPRRRPTGSSPTTS